MMKFSNGESLMLKEVIGNVTADHKARIQIRETIKAHFRKESALFHRGIAPLPFFIDEAAGIASMMKTARDAGTLWRNIRTGIPGRTTGESEYSMTRSICSISAASLSTRPMRVIFHRPQDQAHQGQRWEEGSRKRSTYQLTTWLWKIKNGCWVSTQLYSPVRFIFSHSALREVGTIRISSGSVRSDRHNSISQKRQEVGRGLRLCVDNKGVRQDADTLQGQVQQINRLTVIASEGYADFVNDLQKNISEDLYDRPKVADIDYWWKNTSLRRW